MSGRWKTISPSPFPWEQDALDFVQRALPNREPFRAYSNFEFIADDGSINEVDLLIVSRYSIFLVEIKSRPGEVGGDSHTWIWRDGGREYFDDNPLLLTNRKAKKLASLLRKQLTVQKRRTPYIQHGSVVGRQRARKQGNQRRALAKHTGIGELGEQGHLLPARRQSKVHQ